MQADRGRQTGQPNDGSRQSTYRLKTKRDAMLLDYRQRRDSFGPEYTHMHVEQIDRDLYKFKPIDIGVHF